MSSYTVASSFCSQSYSDSHPFMGDTTDMVKYWHASVAINSVFPSKYYAAPYTTTNAFDRFQKVAEHCVKSTWNLSLEQCKFDVTTQTKYSTFYANGSLQEIRGCISPECTVAFKVFIIPPHDEIITIEFDQKNINWPTFPAMHLLCTPNTIDCNLKIIWIIKSVAAGGDRYFARFSDAVSTFQHGEDKYSMENSISHVDFSPDSKKKVHLQCKKEQLLNLLNEWKSDVERTKWIEGDDYSKQIYFKLYYERDCSPSRSLVAHFNLYQT